MMLKILYNTMAMVEDDNTFYNSLDMMPVKIIAYKKTRYIVHQ